MTPHSRWLQLMLVAFVANGIGPFGLKILSEQGLATTYQAQYLLYWYLGAFVFARGGSSRSRLRPYGREIWLGALMGGCSLLGQSFTGLALSHGMPGHVVFPITTGGSLFLVARRACCCSRRKSDPTGWQAWCWVSPRSWG